MVVVVCLVSMVDVLRRATSPAAGRTLTQIFLANPKSGSFYAAPKPPDRHKAPDDCVADNQEAQGAPNSLEGRLVLAHGDSPVCHL